MSILTRVPVHFINNVTPLWASVIVFCATTLGVVMIACVVLFLVLRKLPHHYVFSTLEHTIKKAGDIFIVFVTAGSSYVLSVMFKNIFMIGRPAMYDFDLHPLLNLTGYGFPSSHASFYSAIAFALFWMNRTAGTFAIIVAVVIGVARVLAGVHSPIDIVGGFVLGLVIACLVDFIVEKLNDWKTL